MKSHFGYNDAAAYSAPRRPIAARIGGMMRAIAAAPAAWARRRRERRALPHLNDHLLRDMGLPRSYADRVDVRPYWRL